MQRAAQSPLLDWIRSAYAPAETLDDWTRRLARKARGLVPGAAGVVGGILETSGARAGWRYAVDTERAPMRDLLIEHESSRPTRVDFLMGDPGLRTSKEAVEARIRAGDEYMLALKRKFDAVGIQNMVHLTAYDGEGAWVSIGFLIDREGASAGDPAMWSMAAVHFATAMRLQRLVSRGAVPRSLRVEVDPGRPRDAEEAIAELGAEASARDRLRAVVRAIDAGGGEQRATSDGEVLSIWQGLVAGTWSLVDQHDVDGRRYLVAVENPVVARDARGLSPREAVVAAFVAEGYSEKWIAYTLGIGRTTVANHLRAALGKLGLPSAVSLARAFHALGGKETR